MPSAPQPIRALVGDLDEFWKLAREARQQSTSHPASKLSVLTAFLFAYHVRDWAKAHGHNVDDYFSTCPFGETVQEIANGTKHFELRHPNGIPKSAISKGAEPVKGYGMGEFGRGPYGSPYLAVRTRRFPVEEEHLFSANDILNQALEWWSKKLGLV
jgi:hypothetical protein